MLNESRLDNNYVRVSLLLGMALVALVLVVFDLATFNISTSYISLSNPKHQSIAFTLIILCLWLTHSFLWKSCNPIARKKYSSKFIHWALNSLALILFITTYPTLVQATFLEGFPLLWHLFFLSLGAATGFFCSILAEAALLIRTKEEAEALDLPIMPIAVWAQFRMWLPLVGVLFATYYLVQKYLILNLNWLEAVLFSLGFLNSVLVGLLPYYFSLDEVGNRVSFQDKVKGLKEVFNKHDYTYKLFSIRKDIDMNTYKTPKELQVLVEQKINEDLTSKSDLKFQGKYLGITEDEVMEMEITYSDESIPSEIVHFPKAYFKELLEEYLKKHKPKNQEEINKATSYALNEGVIRVWKETKIPSLNDLVISAQYDLLKDVVSKREVDLNESGNGGWTPLLHAAANGNIEIMRLLLTHSANPNCKNLVDRTPLHFGAFYDDNQVSELLIEYGANPNLHDDMGNTPLMTASSRGNLELVEILIAAGADKNLKNRAGLTALDLAQQGKHGEIAKRLRKK